MKLQAVIRGHLVRKQASESLQCLLAIIKIQGLIRAHQAQHSPGKIQVNDGFLFTASSFFFWHQLHWNWIMSVYYATSVIEQNDILPGPTISCAIY